jgi:hypothetical protein
MLQDILVAANSTVRPDLLFLQAYHRALRLENRIMSYGLLWGN